jgi:hypothetical protein
MVSICDPDDVNRNSFPAIGELTDEVVRAHLSVRVPMAISEWSPLQNRDILLCPYS